MAAYQRGIARSKAAYIIASRIMAARQARSKQQQQYGISSEEKRHRRGKIAAKWQRN